MDVHVHRFVSVAVKTYSIESETPFWVTKITITEEGVKLPHVIKLFSNGDKLIIQEEENNG
jgi:hypothetical protein